MAKRRLYFDMDNVLVDFSTGIAKLSDDVKAEYEGRFDEVPGIFSLMEPMTGAIEAVNSLKDKYDVYILSTAPWLNPSAWSDKLIWVQKYFGKGKENPFYKRLIISHNKHLNNGDILSDDRPNNGAKDFNGEWICFGSSEFPNWESIVTYLKNKQ